LNELFAIAGLAPGAVVCDIGAGVAHLTLPLLEAGFEVVAVEPNDAMRANGRKRTAAFTGVSWVEAGGEDTGQASVRFDFVTFGSSFNVMDRSRALLETHRLLKPGRWFACLWNHRNLDDPIQKEIESIIAASVSGYDYGVRREDQTGAINASGLFEDVRQVEGGLIFPQPVEKTIAAWRSHATLHRQAGDKFDAVVDEIGSYLKSLGRSVIDIPYTTRAWIARRVD
jgi:SAM-dependent methyltransferase